MNDYCEFKRRRTTEIEAWQEYWSPKCVPITVIGRATGTTTSTTATNSSTETTSSGRVTGPGVSPLP